MTVNPARARLLRDLQAELEAIYRVEAQADVAQFVIDRARWEKLSGTGASEELVVVQGDDDLQVGLFLDDDVYAALDGAGGWTHRKLNAYLQALEGVSHFVYLTHRARVPRPVSRLELELQAEIDKFVLMLLHLGDAARRHGARALRRTLFEDVSFRQGLPPDADERYRKANALASFYCRCLEAKYVVKSSIEGLLADLRRMYRLGAGEKLSYAACGAAI